MCICIAYIIKYTLTKEVKYLLNTLLKTLYNTIQNKNFGRFIK